MRLIDADELIKLHCAEECGCAREECYLKCYKDGCDSCLFVTEIENAPTVDAEPVRHGRWVEGIACSECRQVDLSKPNYCPNCGAKMDGDRE